MVDTEVLRKPARQFTIERVCLEPINLNIWLGTVLKMEDFKELEISVWSLQTGEWLTLPKELKKRPSAKSVQAALANHLMLLMAETPIVVSDKEKQYQYDYCRWEM